MLQRVDSGLCVNVTAYRDSELQPQQNASILVARRFADCARELATNGALVEGAAVLSRDEGELVDIEVIARVEGLAGTSVCFDWSTMIQPSVERWTQKFWKSGSSFPVIGPA